MKVLDLAPYIKAVNEFEPLKVYGKVIEITGILIKAAGLKVSLGEACKIYPVNESFSYTLYRNVPDAEDYRSVIKTQSPVLLFDAIKNRYDFGVIEVDVYAEQ